MWQLGSYRPPFIWQEFHSPIPGTARAHELENA
jgi:hypothetical protein